jgi:parallel beta-helix repeat protein
MAVRILGRENSSRRQTAARGALARIPGTVAVALAVLTGMTARPARAGVNATSAECQRWQGAATTRVNPTTAADLQTQLSAAVAGAMIELSANTTYSTTTEFTISGRNGTSNNRIYLCGPATAVLQSTKATSGADHYALHLNNSSYWTIDGFSARTGNKGVILEGSSNNLIRYLTVFDTSDDGVRVRKNSQNNTLEYNTISQAGTVNASKGSGITVGSPTGDWATVMGNSATPDNSSYNTLRQNTVKLVPAYPVDVREGTHGGRLDSNTLDGSKLTGGTNSTACVKVRGTGYTVIKNACNRTAQDGFNAAGANCAGGSCPVSGETNVFDGNTADMRKGDGTTATGYAVNTPAGNGNMATCSNKMTYGTAGHTTSEKCLVVAPATALMAIVNGTLDHLPVIPNTTCAITLNGDGVTDNTSAFNTAIASCSAGGGGHVNVGAGTYLTGAIELKSNVDLHFTAAATVKFSSDVSKFPVVATRYEGVETMNHSPMIHAAGQTNISITGPGTFDASATGTWNKGSDRTQLEPWANAAPRVPVQNRWPLATSLRSTFFEPNNCTNVFIQGITLTGSRFWQYHPLMSKYVYADKITSSYAGAQTDGFDPESDDHVVITNSSLSSGDDSIAIKSGRDADGRYFNTPSQNIAVLNTQLQTRWGFITVGSEMTGSVYNVYGYNLSTIVGKNCQFVAYIKSNSQRGGNAVDYHLDIVNAVVAHSVTYLTMVYNNQTGSFYPTFDKITLGHVTVSGDWSYAASDKAVNRLYGISSTHPIGSVNHSNSSYSNAPNGATSSNSVYAPNVTWTNTTVNGVLQ